MNKMMLLAAALLALPVVACDGDREPRQTYPHEVPGPGPHEPQMPE